MALMHRLCIGAEEVSGGAVYDFGTCLGSRHGVLLRMSQRKQLVTDRHNRNNELTGTGDPANHGRCTRKRAEWRLLTDNLQKCCSIDD